MGLNVKKPVFRISDEERLNPISSATVVVSLDMILSKKQITKVLISLHRCAGWSAPLLFAYHEDRFSHVKAHIMCSVLIYV